MEILIVEDDNVSRTLLNKILRKMGYSIVEAANGAQAWNILQTRRCNLIITDWMMPEMDGVELCRRIRGSSLDGYIYVIMLTARDCRNDLVHVLQAGADDYVSKPFDPEELRARVMTGLRIIELNQRLVEAASQMEFKNAKLKKTLKRLEETQAQMLQSEKMASIGQLAAGVAHEINNPTGFVSSNLKTLEDYFKDIVSLIRMYRDCIGFRDVPNSGTVPREAIRETKEALTRFEERMELDFILDDIAGLISECREGTDRITKIVLDLKDFAHPGEDQIQSTDINKGLDSTLNVVNNELKYKAVVYKDFGSIPMVRGYPQQLNQVFINILVNAAQAMEKNGEIRIRTRQVDRHVEITIADTGCGIAPEHLPKIFDPFFTTKDIGQGTGLGMHIAYKIISKHGGMIDVQSQIGHGTIFRILIPAEVSETEE